MLKTKLVQGREMRTVTPVCAAVIFVQLCGCASGASIKQRLDYAAKSTAQDIDSLENLVREQGSPRPFALTMLKMVRAAIATATVDSLRSPAIAAAGISKEGDALTLHVYWLADVPSVDAIEIDVPDSKPILESFSAADISSKKDDSKTTVEYCSIVGFQRDSAIARGIQAQWGNKRLRVCLTSSGKRIAENSSIVFGTPLSEK
jgi:hypothetical protein